jgi:hypothetical protein
MVRKISKDHSDIVATWAGQKIAKKLTAMTSDQVGTMPAPLRYANQLYRS